MNFNSGRQIASDIFAVVSATSSIAAWQEQLDWALRVAASILAILAGVYSIMVRYNRAKK